MIKRTDDILNEKRNRRKVGTEYEQKACAFLEGAGMQIVETNYRTIGETILLPDKRNWCF